jgi:hypothetical protein
VKTANNQPRNTIQMVIGHLYVGGAKKRKKIDLQENFKTPAFLFKFVNQILGIYC